MKRASPFKVPIVCSFEILRTQMMRWIKAITTLYPGSSGRISAPTKSVCRVVFPVLYELKERPYRGTRSKLKREQFYLKMSTFERIMLKARNCYRRTPSLWNVLILSMLVLNYYTLYTFNMENYNRLPAGHYRHSVLKRDLRNSSTAGNDVRITRNATNATSDENNTMSGEDLEEAKTKLNSTVTMKPKRMNFTFATLLCDDKLLQATFVLVYSLVNYAKTRYPVTIMALPNVSDAARLQLRKLGAQILDIEMLEYPFKITPARREQNKPCRYSKLQLWSMTQFDKIVYMDSDMMAVQNIDSIFDEYDEFSAVVDAYPGIFNTGIFLLEPNVTTYKNLIGTYKEVESYNVGDQGYLNWYFGRKWRSNTSYHLPLIYNVLIKYRDSVIWPTIKDNIKVVHFTAETKPWNIHYSQHVDWKKNSDPALYFKWVKTRRMIDHVMGRDSKFKKLNQEIEEKCDAEIELIVNNKNNLDKRFSIKDKFSVVLSTFDRTELAMKLIKHYAISKLVDRIFLLWHNPRVNVPKAVTELAKKIKSPAVYVIK